MMKKEDFYFKLPEELIAQDPLEDRSASRLLVLDKESGKIEHRMFRDIKAYLKPGDCLVINDTKVIPARLIGSKIGTDAKIEILLLKIHIQLRCHKIRYFYSLTHCYVHLCSNFFYYPKMHA